jgi:hypothetical protein
MTSAFWGSSVFFPPYDVSIFRVSVTSFLEHLSHNICRVIFWNNTEMASASICRINICRITFIVKNMILVSTTIPVRTGFRIYCPYKLRSSSVQERRKKIFILKRKVYMICLQQCQCLFDFFGNLRGNFSGFQAILNYL